MMIAIKRRGFINQGSTLLKTMLGNVVQCSNDDVTMRALERRERIQLKSRF